MCEDNTGNNAAADANAQPDHEVVLLAEDEQVRPLQLVHKALRENTKTIE